MSNARSWSRSLEVMIKDEEGYTQFKKFLVAQDSSENLDFWSAVENYRNVPKENLELEAKSIHRSFLTAKSRRCVTMKGPTRSKILLDLKAGPTRYMYDAAQKEIMENMRRDPYQRYIKSEDYKKLLI